MVERREIIANLGPQTLLDSQFINLKLVGFFISENNLKLDRAMLAVPQKR